MQEILQDFFMIFPKKFSQKRCMFHPENPIFGVENGTNEYFFLENTDFYRYRKKMLAIRADRRYTIEVIRIGG
jgi:hypothetical protein